MDPSKFAGDMFTLAMFRHLQCLQAVVYEIGSTVVPFVILLFSAGLVVHALVAGDHRFFLNEHAVCLHLLVDVSFTGN